MRISDWSSDVCSSDLKTETVDPSTFSLGRAANRIFADGASAVFSSAGTPLTRIRLSSNHKGNSYPRDWRVARLDTFLTVSALRSEEHTSELQSLMRISYAVFCLKTKHTYQTDATLRHNTNS